MTEEELKTLQITGAGGGKGGGDSGVEPPDEAPDTLFSKSQARIVVAVCEGNIEGFPGGNADKLKRVFLNDTPIQTESGGSNFETSDITVSNLRTGTNTQNPLNSFDDVEIEQSVGVKVTQQGGQTSVTTTRSDLDFVRVRVGVAALYKVDDESGDIGGTKVKYKVKIKDSVSSGNIVNQDFTIDGKSRGPFEEERIFALTGTGPWTVTVRRETDDSDSTLIVNDFFFKAIVGVIGAKFIYPKTAVIGMKFNAEAFSSVPKVSMLIRGKKIQVPSNYNPATVDTQFKNAYTGTWDGTFKSEYSNNPAWVFYDLLVNNRYGCGDFMKPEDIDKFALYDIGVYCDKKVKNGKGGNERRFVFNGHINNRGEAFDVLNSIAATFRGMLYYHQGTVVPVQDSPANSVRLFTPANVIQEVDDAGNLTSPPFTYEGTGRKTRKTVCLVSWNDPNDRYKAKVEYVEDRSAIEKYGHREMEVRALGCTSQGQAQRVGRWNLVTNLTETETVSFKVSAEGFFILPGEIIEIGDPSKTGGVAAGFIEENSDENTIFLDRQVTLASGTAYQLHALINGKMKAAPVTTGAGVKTQLTVNPGFSKKPDIGGMWVLKEDTGVDNLRQYRVIGVQEGGDGTVQVMAVQHNKDKYDQIESDTLIQTQSASVVTVGSIPAVNSESISVGFST
jgi:predicted phage tail protein